MTNSLTPQQQAFYQDNGNLVDPPAIYTPAEMAENNRNLKGSHRAGIIQHLRSTATDPALTLELESGTFREETGVGLTIRYSGAEAKNDLTVNPHFKAYLGRGVDRYKHNPVGTPQAEKFGRTNFKAVSLEEAGRG